MLATRDVKHTAEDQMSRLYVPSEAKSQWMHYQNMAHESPDLHLVVETLPPVGELTREAYLEISRKPGLLALDVDHAPTDGTCGIRAVPFVVPGGWFNEFFGWDSYFISIGLLLDDRTDLVQGVVRNWIFEIEHYGLIPNANRSYLMLRSQPPFLTDLCLRLYHATETSDPKAKEFLKRGIKAAIKEYHLVWMTPPRLDKETGLSRYWPGGVGVPPEVELDFFAPVLKPFADKYGTTCEKVVELFNAGEIDEPELEAYFLHDRATRESGHDTQNRLENKTADLAIIDLNCLLYKFETDIAFAIHTVFQDDFGESENRPESEFECDLWSSTWHARAEARKAAIDRYLWNEDRGIYVDYNTRTKRQEAAESATTLWSMWCGVASPRQADLVVKRGLPLFECVGGLASSSKATGFMNTTRPYQCQWDYPHGWAPHQMMAWDGLVRYGYTEVASRLAYKWLHTILRVFVDHSGAVLEKYDVTRTTDPHLVDTEYPNQGLQFEGYAKEGFGWTNASFAYGLLFVNSRMKHALGIPVPFDILEGL
ncbi:hypothetical protein DCS_06052 [Drechmeria coniospora]|uniref:Trehalase n=1 Tax=Drechmeria coniospora TaxID=98403 RepID=A0A151GAH5_DRECN|nr:hypothetical protein DCS_06052 [Drechmeria coniospora]KYK54096.1 hypothetical protein DCS_06052 [Drechmeria coniospora]